MPSLTIPAISPRTRQIADGINTVFNFAFPILASGDLKVTLNAAPQTSGFAIAGVGQSDGGTVTFDTPPASGVVVTLERRMPLQRVTDFLEGGTFAAQSINSELDALTAMLQQIAADQDGMLRVNDATAPLLPDAATRAGQILGFDGTGAIQLYPPSSSAAPASYSQSGAGAISRSFADKAREHVSIRDFGAVGDGVADDTLAIQAALTASQSVFVPAGTYRITAPLTLGFGQRLYGLGEASVIRATGFTQDVIRIIASYAALDHLKLENGAVGVRLYGATSPCVQNNLSHLSIWDAATGIVLDGYQDTNNPCYWNALRDILIARPTLHGMHFMKSGAGDTPNANKLSNVRVYSLGTPMSGNGFYLAASRYNTSLIDCEANLSPSASACVRIGANCDKNLLVNLYCETLGGVPNVVLEAGSVETSIINLFSASAGPAIQDFSGGQYTALNAGFPDKNRLRQSRISDLTVEQLRLDTEFFEAPAAATLDITQTSSCYLISAFNGVITARLPLASSANGAVITLKKTDSSANAVLVTENGGNGADNRTITLSSRYDFVTVVSNGAAWHIIGHNLMPQNAAFYESLSLITPEPSRAIHLVSSFAGAVTFRLPPANASESIGRTLTIKKTDPSANAVTVTEQGGAGPDGASVVLTTRYHAVTVFSNGAAWHILSRNP